MSVEHFQRMIDYMIWADRRLWQSIALLSDEAIANPIDYSLGSLHEQVVHTMEAQWIWLERIKGFAPDGFTPASAFPNREAIVERWTRVQEAWQNYIATLQEDDLRIMITYQRVRDKTTFEMRLTDIIAHVVNHTTDHRAQMLALIASYGGQTFEQDYSFYLNSLPKEIPS